jgi:DNA polymerase-3 subunit gamma/tau
VLSVDEEAITIGIVNPGAKESFERSESDVILRNAFIDVVGIDRKIAVVVDPSIDTNTPIARETRTSEAPSDPNQLSGTALLMQELGAQVIEGK